MPTCKRCKAPLDDGVTFCIACGTSNSSDEKKAGVALQLDQRTAKLHRIEARSGSIEP